MVGLVVIIDRRRRARRLCSMPPAGRRSGATQNGTAGGDLPGLQRRLDRPVDQLIGQDCRTAGALFAAEVVAPSFGFLRRTEESDRLLAEPQQDLRTGG